MRYEAKFYDDDCGENNKMNDKFIDDLELELGT